MTEFIDWALQSANSYTLNVLDDTMTIPVGPVEDTVSQQSGNNDGVSYCG